MSSSATREMRREEYSSNVIRTLQPSRPLSPYSHKPDFDNNLDTILDDLQHSISRPGSSLGQPITNYSSHRDVHYIQPANSTTIMRERSLSPTSNTNRVYKTTKYEYSSNASNVGKSGGERGNLNEINKLDTLLSDLENERTATLDRNKRNFSSNIIGIDSGLLDPNTKVIKTTTTYTSKNPVSRELVFDSPEPVTTSSINRTIRHQSQSPSFDTSHRVSDSSRRNVTYNEDGLYGKSRYTASPTPPQVGGTQYHITETKTRTLSPTPTVVTNNTEKYHTESRTVSNSEVAPKNNFNEIVRVENSTGPEVLNEIHLSNDILPRPKTKVTTTIRTYTYEIPDDVSNRELPPNNAVFYKTERNERNVNYYPNPSSPLSIQEVPYSPSPVPQSPENVIRSYKYESNSSRPPSQQHGNVPPGGITIYPNVQPSTTVYKTTETTTNKQYRSPTPSNQYLPHDIGFIVNNNGYQPHAHPNPNEPSVVVYKQTTTTRNLHRPAVEREPMLHPFPVDGPIITEVDGSPPKRVEDLMASFGDTSEIHYTKKNVQIAEKPLTPQNNTSTLSSTQRNVYSSEPEEKSKSAVVPSKNVAGPAVYYPPNHELFTRKEESGAYRAQGGWARGQGKYMHESESKSKSSSKSGAAVVPLCCPLCCALPCTIM